MAIEGEEEDINYIKYVKEFIMICQIVIETLV